MRAVQITVPCTKGGGGGGGGEEREREVGHIQERERGRQTDRQTEIHDGGEDDVHLYSA